MNQYLKNNPAARAIFESHRAEKMGKLFENEAVDSLLRTICDACTDIYQKITFDVAPGTDRNPKATREKLAPLANANNITSLLAVFREDAAANAVRDPAYADSKNYYLQALEKYTEALKIACDINKANEKFILDYIKNITNTKQSQTEYLAKAHKEEQELVKDNNAESFYFYDDSELMNESGIFTGYRGRVEDLRKMLANLIISAKDKTSKNGYGRDWQTTFVDLDEKRKALDTNKGAFGEKDKKALDDLEAQVDKYRLEYLKASNTAIDKSLEKVENDEELNGAYADVNTLCDEAKLLKTRAESQYTTALITIKDDHKEKEAVFNKTLFPITRGNTDADDKFKDSGLIFAIQKALCDGIPAAGKLIKSKGGPNGKYGPATKSVIATIQKMEGNKNINGEIDQALLTDILASDWVSEENKKAINKALDIAKVKMVADSLFTVFSFNDFVNESSKINEGKITINNDDFEKELANQYKETISSQPLASSGDKTESKEGDENETEKSGASGSGDANKLAEKLRSLYSLKVEGKNFTRTDGSLLPSYPSGFIKAWIKALDNVGKEPKQYGYFFYDGGLYRINRADSSLKTPYNWPKFEKSGEADDPLVFLKKYIGQYGTFGNINNVKRYQALEKIMDAAKNTKKDYVKGLAPIVKKMGALTSNKETPFIAMEDMKGPISRAFELALDSEQGSSDLGDLGLSEYLALNLLVVGISNCVTYDASSKKFLSCIKWVADNIMTEAVCNELVNDAIRSGTTFDPLIVTYSGDSLVGLTEIQMGDITKKKMGGSYTPSKGLSSFNVLAKTKEPNINANRGALALNIRKITTTIYPIIRDACKRINAITYEDVPQGTFTKCVDVK